MPGDPHWLEPAQWKWAQDHLPIACADVLPVQRGPGGRIHQVGLISRNTPHQGDNRWCLVGGRLRRNESFAAAIARQLQETLGSAVAFDLPPDLQPATVAQYFTDPRDGQLLDPRQHAVAMVFVVAIGGAIQPTGEAAGFQWFEPAHLPAPETFGFGQDAVVRRCLADGGATA